MINAVKLFSSKFKTDGKIQRNEANFNIPHTLANGKYTVLPVYRIQGEKRMESLWRHWRYGAGDRDLPTRN